jgi:hypothetical protein
MLEMIASTYQIMLDNPGKDHVLVITADKDTYDEKGLAIRPIGVRDVNAIPLERRNENS